MISQFEADSYYHKNPRCLENIKATHLRGIKTQIYEFYIYLSANVKELSSFSNKRQWLGEK